MVWELTTNLFLVLYFITIIGIILMLLMENRSPVKSIAWIFVLILLPVVGLLLYILVGKNFRKKMVISHRSLAKWKERIETIKGNPMLEKSFPKQYKNFAYMAVNSSNSTLYVNNGVRLFTTGKEFFDSMFAEVEKARKRFGDSFDEAKYRETSERVREAQEKRDALHERYQQVMNAPGGIDLEGMKQIILDEEIVCPISGTRNWTDVRQFNLMFKTEVGAAAEGASTIYLRPETAQGIFVNYLNVQKTGRMKLPFGIAQIGKAFRNEIVARQFIFRMREFEQMEMQFFVKPGTELEWFSKWKETRMRWHQNLGFGAENYRFHDHDKLAHYANAATDIEFRMPFGFKEVEGIHSRTNFDLSSHAKYSGKKIEYFDPETNESYTPFVIETSIGVDRMFLSIMCHSFEEQKLDNGETRTVLHLPAALAPVKLAVFPLTKKDGMPEKAQEIINELRFHFNCKYEEKDQIGKRYRRMDAIGCPYCVTVDQQTMQDDTVTLRDRDTMEQRRVKISELRGIIEDQVSITSLLKRLL